MTPAIDIAYKNAMECQDACNLSGVLNSFNRDMSAIWDEANSLGKGTEYVNTHPIVIVYLFKLCSLAGISCQSHGGVGGDRIEEAYNACASMYKLICGKEPPHG